MTHDEIAAAWSCLGAAAREASFRVSEQHGRLYLIADLAGPHNSQVRSWRSLPENADRAAIEEALAHLYADLVAPPAPPRIVRHDGA